LNLLLIKGFGRFSEIMEKIKGRSRKSGQRVDEKGISNEKINTGN